jgi:putative ABC transport system permease protein
VTFYLRMVWHSLQQRRGLTLVMIAALSLGIGTWYVQHQIFAFLDDKMPAAPAGVYQVMLERGELAPPGRPQNITPLVPSMLLAPRDARAVFVAGGARRQTLTFSAQAVIEPATEPAEIVQVRYATRDLFAMFEVPLVEGQPWSELADRGLFSGAAQPEAVIEERFARRLFGDAAVGQTLRVDGADVRIVGVVAERYDVSFRIYARLVQGTDVIYLPLAHATQARAEPNVSHLAADGETGFVSTWVELWSPAEEAMFIANVQRHLASDRVMGRAATPRSATLRSAEEWKAVFAPGGAINMWPLLSGLCVATAIVNLIRMLMAKFAGRSHDLGLLRALGARRRGVIAQLLLEAVSIGLAAGIGGLAIGVASMPLAASTIRSTSGSPDTITVGAVLFTLGSAIGAALLAAVYPVWRLSRGTPSAQMRTR